MDNDEKALDKFYSFRVNFDSFIEITLHFMGYI